VGDEYREAIRLKPDLAEPHDNLANHYAEPTFDSSTI
jgi:hypothetical protein